MKNSPAVFRAGTRSSELATIQATDALSRIEGLLPGVSFTITAASSPGDRDRGTDLRESPADFFTEDLDRAVLSGDLDCAVHSAKDVPYPVADGLDWCWLPWREDPRDVLVLRPGMTRADLPASPRIGVSSDRREAWSRRAFSEGVLLPIRGNIGDRLAQLDAGAFDVVIMASAALIRLGLTERITEWIPLDELCVPDGQGVLAMTFRAGDVRFARLRSLFVKPVAFVGAGVGSAGMCTVVGVEALRHCDICMHDTLMDAALLDHVPADATIVNVGKRAGAHTVLQEDTTRMLLDYARRGLRVVRLKGGDPCIFGRLAEEVEALEGLHLPYRVIPGISSLSVMGASTGILLTRRGTSNGFTVMSGRGQGGTVSSVAVDARQELPLVLFMSLSVLPELLAQLREDGVEEGRPAAVVLEAGSPREAVLRGTVATIEGQLAEAVGGERKMPAGLVVVGDVASFGFTREWGALRGQRVLLTCSEAMQAEAQRSVLDAGGVPLSVPLISLVPDDTASETAARAGDFDWLVITSPSAARCLLKVMREQNVDIRSLPKILACGPGTLRELRSAGLSPAAVPDENYGGKGVLEVARQCVGEGERVLRVRSDRAGPGLAESLRKLGIEVEDVCVYRNVSAVPEELPACDTVFFASSSAVSAFADTWGVESLVGKSVLSIGQPTAGALSEAGVTDVIVSPESTAESAIACLAADCVIRSVLS
jgi:uroporphyrinogen III methyltransferase/synthase